MGKQQIITSQIKDLDRILDSKQDELTAGEGIILENNVISSTGTTYHSGTGININSNNDIEIVQSDFVDVELRGNVVNNNGILSGFNSNGKALIPVMFTPGNKPFEIVLKATTGNDVYNEQEILCGDAGAETIEIGTDSGYFDWEFSNGVQHGYHQIVQPNTTYYLKMTFDGHTYNCYYRLENSAIWVLDYTTQNIPVRENTVLYLGNDSNTGSGSVQFWQGTIDVNECYIELDGKPWWQGKATRVAKATDSLYGLVKVDSNTIIADNGIISLSNDILEKINNSQSSFEKYNYTLLDQTSTLQTGLDLTNCIVNIYVNGIYQTEGINYNLEYNNQTIVNFNTIYSDNALVDLEVLQLNMTNLERSVITLTDNQSSYTFASNNTYEFILGSSVEEVDFTLSIPGNTKIENNILVHLYIGNASMEIDWGTDKFFNNEEPSIDSIGYYDIVYVWNNILNKWVCKVILISDEERITYKNYIVDVTLSGGSPSYIPESNEFEATINEGNTVYSPQIDGSGKAIFTFNNIVESPENYALIEYLGNADYQPAKANIILEEINDVIINLIPAAGNLKYIINMVDSNTYNPIPDISVITRLINMDNGYMITSNETTDSYGEFTQYFDALKYGNYIYSVDFAGNENYESNSANYMIEFTEDDEYYEKIALNPVLNEYNIMIYTNLVDENNMMILTGEPIYQTIYDESNIILYSETLYVDSGGQTQVINQLAQNNTYIIETKFEGDNNYSAKYTNTIVTINDNTPIKIILQLDNAVDNSILRIENESNYIANGNDIDPNFSLEEIIIENSMVTIENSLINTGANITIVNSSLYIDSGSMFYSPTLILENSIINNAYFDSNNQAAIIAVNSVINNTVTRPTNTESTQQPAPISRYMNTDINNSIIFFQTYDSNVETQVIFVESSLNDVRLETTSDIGTWNLIFDNCIINNTILTEYNYNSILNINKSESQTRTDATINLIINGIQVVYNSNSSNSYDVTGVDYTYVQEYNDMMGYPEGKIDYVNKFEPGIIFKVSEGNDFYKTEYVVSVEDNSTIKDNNSMYDNSMYYDNGMYYDNSSITKCVVNIPDNMMITEVYGSGTYNNYMIDTMNNVVLMTTPYMQPDYQMNIVHNNDLYSNYTYPDMNNTLMWPVYEDNGITRQIPLQLFNNMLFIGEDYNSIMYGGERILISINNSLVESTTDEYNNILNYQYNLVPANVNMQINASRIINGTYSHDPYSGTYSWNFNDQNIMIASNSVVNFSNDDFVINSMIDIGNYTKVLMNNGIIVNPNNDDTINNINRIIINTTWNTDLRLTNMYLNYCTINLGSKSIVSLVNTMIMDEEHPMNAIIQTAKDSYGDQVLSLYNCVYRVNDGNNDGNNDNSILITIDNYNSILQPDVYLSTATIFINGVKVQDGIEMH